MMLPLLLSVTPLSIDAASAFRYCISDINRFNSSSFKIWYWASLPLPVGLTCSKRYQHGTPWQLHLATNLRQLNIVLVDLLFHHLLQDLQCQFVCFVKAHVLEEAR
jgi:hypothetical protein